MFLIITVTGRRSTGDFTDGTTRVIASGRFMNVCVSLFILNASDAAHKLFTAIFHIYDDHEACSMFFSNHMSLPLLRLSITL